MKYILFIMAISYGDKDLASAEFNTLVACEDARSEAVIEFGVQGIAVRGFCVAKGEG